MFHEVVGGDETAGGTGESEAVTATELLAAFEALVSETLSEADQALITDETGVDAATVETAGDSPSELTVAEGAAIVSVTADRDADTIVAELRDHLLMGMAMAVLDVDTLASEIDADLTGQEVQQTLEGRAAMTLGQLAEIMAAIERRKR